MFADADSLTAAGDVVGFPALASVSSSAWSRHTVAHAPEPTPRRPASSPPHRASSETTLMKIDMPRMNAPIVESWWKIWYCGS